MFTSHTPAAQDTTMVIVPVRPAPEAGTSATAARTGLLRRVLGVAHPSRRTFGISHPSRRTFGKGHPSRRTFGKSHPSRRTFGINHP
jgi:hypothetical protein